MHLTWGTPSQSSACCMASLAFSTGWFGSQSAQSGHRPDRIKTRWLDSSARTNTDLYCYICNKVTWAVTIFYKTPQLHHCMTLPEYLHCSVQANSVKVSFDCSKKATSRHSGTFTMANASLHRAANALIGLVLAMERPLIQKANTDTTLNSIIQLLYRRKSVLTGWSLHSSASCHSGGSREGFNHFFPALRNSFNIGAYQKTKALIWIFLQ